MITEIELWNLFPASVLRHPPGWREANGSGIWASPGSEVLAGGRAPYNAAFQRTHRRATFSLARGTSGRRHAAEQSLYVLAFADENPLVRTVMLIRSPGRDGTFSGSVYQVSSFEPGRFDEDIVWADGFFVRWPETQPAAQ